MHLTKYEAQKNYMLQSTPLCSGLFQNMNMLIIKWSEKIYISQILTEIALIIYFKLINQIAKFCMYPYNLPHIPHKIMFNFGNIQDHSI